MEAALAVFSRNGDTGTSGGRRLGESSAALSTLKLGGFAFQPPLLSLFAAVMLSGPGKLVVRR